MHFFMSPLSLLYATKITPNQKIWKKMMTTTTMIDLL